MKEYLQFFRLSSAFEGPMYLMKKVWKEHLLLNLAQIVIFIGLGALMLGSTFLYMMDFQSLATMNKMEQQYKALEMLQMFQSQIGIIVLFYLLIFIMFSCYQVIGLKINESYVKTNKFSSSIVFKNFGKNVLKTLGLGFLLFVIFLASYFVILIVFFLFGILKMPIFTIIISFLVFLAFILFMLKFAISNSALINGNLDIIQSIQFSFKNLTIKRVLFIFLFILVLTVAIGVLMFFMASLIQLMGTAGMALFFVVYFLIVFFIYTFTFAAQTSLYYRYSNEETAETDITEHIVQ